MPRVDYSTFVSGLRKRIGMERKALVEMGIDYDILRRAEAGIQKTKSLDAILRELNFPLEGVVYPLLESQPMYIYAIRLYWV